MFWLGKNNCSGEFIGKRALVLGLCWLAAASGAAVASAPPSPAKTQPARTALLAEPAPKPDPEALLIGVYKELAANNLREAQAQADALVEAYPNFRLGHLIRGDLLLMHTRPVTKLGAGVQGADAKLNSLREEAMARLKSLREKPNPDLMPRPILQLRDDQKYALLVDAKRSRLYVYENKGGKLRFVTDYYISHGKLGVNKLRDGDQKTPIGIYYITGRLPGARLPDFYGVGALPINYPNEWDKMNGRSGSGIWLHGTPSDSFSRAPQSSDGCVVLTNPDLDKLSASVEVGKTPIVIAESVEFVNKAKWHNDRSVAARLVEEWRRDVESLSIARMKANYSRRFKSERGEDAATWLSRHQQLFKGVKKVSLNVRDVTYFLYPGRREMLVSTFTQDTQVGKSTSTLRKRQYWAKEGGRWKIVYELNL